MSSSVQNVCRLQSQVYLKALVMSFIRSNIPFVDAGLLQAIRDVVSTIGFGSPDIIAQLEERQCTLSARNDPIDTITNQSEPMGALWRQQVRSLVEGMTAPDQFIWTDDDENSTDYHFAQHALLKVSGRFEMSVGQFPRNQLLKIYCRPLSDASSTARISLAAKLGELTCLLAHCRQPLCSDGAENQYIATIPSCLTVISRLLDGPEAEVTNDVRRRVFAGFKRVIKHHSRNQTLGEFEGVTNIVACGLVDKDRSVRLAAG
jgi:serine/threonine-protein kinase ATR